MSPIIYLITGANRGIGYALVNELITRQDVIVFAATRRSSNSEELKRLAEVHNGKLDIVEFLAGDIQQNRNLAKIVQEKYGYLDVVIANAGPAEDTPLEVFKEHMNVNAGGVLALFQATVSLLKESKTTPKFIPVTSAAGSLTAFIELPLGFTCYSASKAAVNFIARKIHVENEWLTCFPLAPAIVDTDMARDNRVQDKTGVLAKLQDNISIPADKAAVMLLQLIDSSSRGTRGGEFVNIDGTVIPW